MRSNLLVLCVFVFGLAFVGCTKDEGQGPDFDTDEIYLQSAVADPADSIAAFSNSEEESIDDDGAKDPEYSEGFGKIGGVDWPISPLRWGRRITSITRHRPSVAIIGDSAAVVTFTKTIAGNLFILAIRDSGGVVDTVLVTKSFSDSTTRRVLFRRVARTIFKRLNWRPVAISLVDGRSPTNDFDITELRIVTPRDTITVTDPLNTWIRFGRLLPNPLPFIRESEPVQIQVTVTSQNDSAEFVALRWGIGWGDGRRHRAMLPLVSESGGTRVYQRTFFGHRHIGRFNAVIDAVSYMTLFDDVAPYSNKFWGLAYICVP